VRCFKYLHQGIISPIPRKSLPEIAKVVGVSAPQSLHHFIANSPWSVEELKKRRLTLTLEALKKQKITVVIDETGDRKKGTKTDYVARQYLGSVGKIDRGMVSVNAYGVYKNITFPLIFKVFKPKETLKEEDRYQTKIELASCLIRELVDFGFNIELVVADSLYGEASSFIATLNKYELLWILAIRNNHGVWWEIILSAYLMISLNTQAFLLLNLSNTTNYDNHHPTIDWTSHPQWNHQTGWKNVLNNFRLIIQPSLLLWLIFPTVEIFPSSSLLLGIHSLISTINQFQFCFLSG
jgi:hypothetical protein